MFIAFIKIPEV